jgi:hypothetical protein
MFRAALIGKNVICEFEDKRVVELEIEFTRKITNDRL